MNRTQQLTRAALNKAKALAPNLAPQPSEDVVTAWADALDESLKINVPVEVWEAAVTHWAMQANAQFLTVGKLAQAIRTTAENWRSDPRRREIMERHTKAVEAQRNLERFGSVDGRRPLKELGRTPTPEEIERVKKRFPQLRRNS